jgi:hypothetical protein
VVEPRKKGKEKKKKKGHAVTAEEEAKKGATVAPPPARVDDKRPEIESHRHNEEGTDTDIEDCHAPLRTANIRGDFNTERGNKDVVRRRACNGQAEDLAYGDQLRLRRHEEGHDGRYYHKGPGRKGQRKGVTVCDAPGRGTRTDHGKSHGTNEDGGAESDRDRHLGE